MFRNAIAASVIALVSFTSFALTGIATAEAQSSYPNRPITFIVPYPPGGLTDLSARLIGQKLSQVLGQPVIIDNRGGAGGVVGTAAVVRAKPDGYTIGQISTGTVGTSPHFDTLPYDVLKDFTPVANMVTSYTALVASKSAPFNTVSELVTYAKANPGKVFFASSGVGGISHISGELLKSAAGIDLVHVPYSGSAAALTDLMAGRVQIFFDSTPVEHIKAGQVKGLAAIGHSRIKALPDLPTIYEAGVPGFKGGDAWLGVIGPAGIPPDVVKTLSDALLKVAQDPDYIQKMDSYGLQVTPQGPKDFAKQIVDDYNLYGDVIKQANITVNAAK